MHTLLQRKCTAGGTFYDARLNNSELYPVAAKSGSSNTRGVPDRVTSKLAALHFYQLAIPAPKPADGSFDKNLAAEGKTIFDGKAKCATCHVPPLFTEPGNNLHAASEVGVDSFQAEPVADPYVPYGAACRTLEPRQGRVLS